MKKLWLSLCIIGSCINLPVQASLVDQDTQKTIPTAKILIAEFNEVSSIIAERSLKDLGCAELTKVTTGLEVLNEFTNENRYDVLLIRSDLINEQDTNVIEILRGRYSKKELIIIGTTSDISPKNLDFLLAAELDGYCVKPCSRETLYLEINRCFAAQAAAQN